MTRNEIIYLGHDNSIDLILKADGAAVSLTAVTKMTLTVGVVTIPSANGVGDPITWNKEGYASGEIRLSLGGLSLTPGGYRAILVVYDTSNPNGVVWDNYGAYLPIEIRAEVEMP